MKKALLILLVCIIIMSMLSGCGSGSKQSDLEAANEELKKVEEEVNKAAKEAGSDVKVSLGEMGSNLKAPDNFPKDVVPLLDDANIVNVNDNKDADDLLQQSDQNTFFMD